MQKLMLLGDEAIAQGALDAGLSGVYAYPGTPSTEITEYIQKSKQAIEGDVHRTWSANEKTAMEAAIGMSYAGKRALVCMKHVGLNVAADAFVNSAITGANGGLVVLAADDPSMHSSQNEQDSRFYGKFSFMPVFEPSNQQEAYDMMFQAFELSETMKLPVLMRVTTRLAHSRAAVARKEVLTQNKGGLPENLRQFVLLPAIARKQYAELLEKQPQLEQAGIDNGNNQILEGEDLSMGIITTGIAYNYLIENYPEGKVPYPVLKITQYPAPTTLVEKLVDRCDSILVLEEGMPFLEEQLRGLLAKGLNVKGRLDGTVNRTGELNPNIVAKALGMEDTTGSPVPELVKGRPPKLCDGCPHIDSYQVLNEAMESYGSGRVFADIGCYTLAALPPLEAINSCVDMGASITMAKGAADAGMVPAVAVIGDSTFTHSGITALLDAVMDKSPITVLILDNATTGMTGGQASHALGKIEDIVKGLGVEEEHIRVVKPLKKFHGEMLEVYKEELAYDGVSVIIPRRECIQTISKRMRAKIAAKKKK
ncbi:MAG: indolepyruvate ferredoxin oxidoreductase [Bacteroidetes bacterium]|nr:MAG: indolepyruvate ferredoxin oxidoreductase [Bacteroidota bacterium]